MPKCEWLISRQGNETECDWSPSKFSDRRHSLDIADPDYEVVFRWPNGREEVRYRRPNADPKCREEVARLHERLGDECPYFIREISRAK